MPQQLAADTPLVMTLDRCPQAEVTLGVKSSALWVEGHHTSLVTGESEGESGLCGEEGFQCSSAPAGGGEILLLSVALLSSPGRGPRDKVPQGCQERQDAFGRITSANTECSLCADAAPLFIPQPKNLKALLLSPFYR